MPKRTLKILVVAATLIGIIVIYRFQPSGSSQGKAQARTPVAQTIARVNQASLPQNTAHEAKMLASELRKNPGHVPILLRLAKIAADSGHPDEAIARLQEALQHEPGNVEARLDLGKLLFEKGDVRAAIEQNEAIIKIKPDYPDALYNLGAIYGNLGNGERAEQYWRRLLSTSPQSDSGRRAGQMLAVLKRDSGAGK